METATTVEASTAGYPLDMVLPGEDADCVVFRRWLWDRPWAHLGCNCRVRWGIGRAGGASREVCGELFIRHDDPEQARQELCAAMAATRLENFARTQEEVKWHPEGPAFWFSFVDKRCQEEEHAWRMRQWEAEHGQ